MTPPPVRPPHCQARGHGVVLCPRGDRPQEEHLLKRKLALENVALGQAHDPLDIGQVTTWRCRIAFFRFGAYCASVSTTVSPKASRRASVQPPFSWYARTGQNRHHVLSRRRHLRVEQQGMTMSMCGRFEYSPYFASSYARSR